MNIRLSKSFRKQLAINQGVRVLELDEKSGQSPANIHNALNEGVPFPTFRSICDNWAEQYKFKFIYRDAVEPEWLVANKDLVEGLKFLDHVAGAGISNFGPEMNAQPRTNESSRVFAQQESSPLAIVDFEVLVSRNGQHLQRVGRLAPLCKGDSVRFSAKLSEAAFVRLLWLDAEGNCEEFYPTAPGKIREFKNPIVHLESPESLNAVWPIHPTGLSETAILAVDRTRTFYDWDPTSAKFFFQNSLSPQLEEVRYYRSSTPKQTLSTWTASERRSLEHEQIVFKDPVICLLEHLVSQVQALAAICIPCTTD